MRPKRQLDASVSQKSVLMAIRHQDYGLALSGAFSYLDGALGDTRRKNERMMKQAVRDNLTAFCRAMLGYTEKEMPGGIGRFVILHNGVQRDVEDVLYDMRCSIQHKGDLNDCSVVLTENEIVWDLPNGACGFPLSVIFGILAVADAIRSNKSENVRPAARPDIPTTP